MDGVDLSCERWMIAPRVAGRGCGGPVDAGDAAERKLSYCGVIKDHAVILTQEEGFLELRLDQAVEYDPERVAAGVQWYFALDEDQAAIERELASKHPVLGEIIRKKPGLRILRQDPWECLTSFILSVHNNIPAIERSIEALCEMLGNPAGFRRKTYPGPCAVANCGEEALGAVRCGFRARYLTATAKKIVSGEVDLNGVGSLPTPAARSELVKLPGVGRKVADCVLLFAYRRLEVFPVDVWVKRAMARLYPETTSMPPERVAEEGERRFGRYAGYAQEYLYWLERTRALAKMAQECR